MRKGGLQTGRTYSEACSAHPNHAHHQSASQHARHCPAVRLFELSYALYAGCGESRVSGRYVLLPHSRPSLRPDTIVTGTLTTKMESHYFGHPHQSTGRYCRPKRCAVRLPTARWSSRHLSASGCGSWHSERRREYISPRTEQTKDANPSYANQMLAPGKQCQHIHLKKISEEQKHTAKEVQSKDNQIFINCSFHYRYYINPLTPIGVVPHR